MTNWLVDPRFADDELRGQHGELISARVAQWCTERTLEQAFQQLGDAKIPCGPVLSPQQALKHPQITASQLLKPLAFPGMPHPAPVTRGAFTLSDTPKVPLQRAPLLGEHTDEVLAELGYAAAEIAQLRELEVI